MLSASSVIGRTLKKKLRLEIDLKPALTVEQLDARVLREFEEHNKQFKNAIDKLFPAKLKPVMIELSGLNRRRRSMRFQRGKTADCLPDQKFYSDINGLRRYNEAIITKGGVNVKEIDPGTMESKKFRTVFCGRSAGSGCSDRRI